MMIKIGKAEKRNGTWLLGPWGVENFSINGKHCATVCVAKRDGGNIHLCLTFGNVFVEIPDETTYEI